MNDGGPAFPGLKTNILIPKGVPEETARLIGNVNSHTNGMTLRDWFAGMAMMGNVACSPDPFTDEAQAAEFHYRLADAMLTARATAPSTETSQDDSVAASLDPPSPDRTGQ